MIAGTAFSILLSVLIHHICFYDVFSELCHVFHPLFQGTKRLSVALRPSCVRSFSGPLFTPSLSKECHLFRCSLLSFSLLLSLPHQPSCFLASVLPLSLVGFKFIQISSGPARHSSEGQKVSQIIKKYAQIVSAVVRVFVIW